MSTVGSFNTKNPTIKRILKEASELATNPSRDFHASPLDTNLFEWHFTLRGPPNSAFSSGLYHGRIVLPPTYPLRPPSFRFLTPSGRFEVNREICLSISGHHEESWQPAWGVRTALVALRSFMETDVKGQLGGLQSDDGTRRDLAGRSAQYKCTGCGKTNGLIIKESEEEVDKMEQELGKKSEKETVPEELRLAYREDLGDKKKNETTSTRPEPTRTQPVIQSPVAARRAQIPRGVNRRGNRWDVWIDRAIGTLAFLLVYMILRNIVPIFA